MTESQWKISLDMGKRCIQEKRHEEALSHLSESIKQCAHVDAYEMRSLAYTTLGKHKEALLDSKRAIEMDPKRWQSYARSASIFLQTKRWDASISMANMALARISNDDTQKTARLKGIRDAAEEGKRKGAEEDRRKNGCHIAALPVELLSSIFLDVVSSSYQNLKALNTTCKHWRDVVVKTPSLWATLTVTEKRPLSRAEFWLSRSKDKLQTLRIKGKSISNKTDYKLVNWGTLRRLQLDECSLPLFSLMCYEHDIPPLEQVEDLEIILAEDSRPLASFRNDPRLFLISFMSSKNHDPLATQFPLAQNLTLRNTEVSWSSIAAYRSLVSLEIVTFSAIPADELNLLQAVLEGNPNLRSFSLSFRSSLPLPQLNLQPDRTAPIQLPHLERLHLTRFPFYLDWLFQSISTPALEHLSLDMCWWRDISHFAAPKLKSLTMRYMPRPDPIDILSNTPEIEEVVQVGRDTDALVEWLGRPDNPCKRLHKLNVTKSNVGTGSLLRLVKSRIKKEGEEEDEKIPITSLVIDECPNVDAEWLPRLRQHIKSVSCVYMTRKQAKAARR